MNGLLRPLLLKIRKNKRLLVGLVELVGVISIIVLYFSLKKHSPSHRKRHTKLLKKYDMGQSQVALPRVVGRNSRHGEDGSPAYFNNISETETELRNLIYEKYSVDHYVAERISLDRRVGEHRHPTCLDISYDLKSLSDYRTSVIIATYNEGWATLMRTIHSVLHSTPDVLLQEIIVIDDFSDLKYMGERLENALAKLPKVRLVRNKKRLGLIKTRLIGAQLARSPTITFVDSHVEFNDGWLEPLLQRVSKNQNVYAVPVIAVIDNKTFEFKHDPLAEPQIGVFDWTMSFRWKHPDARQGVYSDSIASPAMAGGIYTVSRETFFRLGGYDEQMKIWGGENIELSLRVWMCGGSIEILPCSVVGHVFPEHSFYDRRSVVPNTIRTVDVWLDKVSRKFFYQRNVDARRLRDTSSDLGDLTKRKEVKTGLHCRPFSWYTETVLRSLKKVSRRDVFGQINAGVNNEIVPLPLCLYPDLFEAKSDQNQLYWDQCEEYAPFTFHLQSETLYLYVDSGIGDDNQFCLGTRADGSLSVENCENTMYQKWQVLERKNSILLRSKSFDKCIERNTGRGR